MMNNDEDIGSLHRRPRERRDGDQRCRGQNGPATEPTEKPRWRLSHHWTYPFFDPYKEQSFLTAAARPYAAEDHRGIASRAIQIEQINDQNEFRAFQINSADKPSMMYANHSRRENSGHAATG
jgi:hypothetical protein